MRRKNDYGTIKIGHRFGRIITTGIPYREGKYYYIKGFCECNGKEKTFRADHLMSELILSCGCIAEILHSFTRRTHGYTAKESSPLRRKAHQTWRSIKARCYRKACPSYIYYGARGILVCESWLKSFDNFIKDMGLPPSTQYSIERKNNDGNYEPSNCIWATATDQSRNNRNAKLTMEKAEMIRNYSANGLTQRVLARKFGVTQSTIYHVINDMTWI